MKKLPKIQMPLSAGKIPSSGKNIFYRPYQVKEENIALMALQTENNDDMALAVRQLLNLCITMADGSDIDLDALTDYDVEYLFIKLYMVSTSDVLKLRYDTTGNCLGEPKQVPVYQPASADIRSEEDKEVPMETKYPCDGAISFIVSLEKDAKVMNPDGTEFEFGSQKKGTQIFKIVPGISMEVRQPSIEDVTQMDKYAKDDALEQLYQFLAGLIVTVFNGEEIIRAEEVEESELLEFVRSLSTKTKNELIDSVQENPRLKAVKTIKCKHCAFEREVEISGLHDFLT